MVSKGKFSCLWISGFCNHDECGSFPFNRAHQPHPTEEEYCEANNHAYSGDDEDDIGRCWCGAKQYEPGGSE